MLDNIQITTLSNGMTVLSTADPDAESVSAGIWIRAGGRYESDSEAGFSHFLEHMLFKGTPSRSSLDITRIIEGCGGYINAYTQEESTCYYTRLPCEYMENSVDVLADMYVNSLLADDEIEREREVIMEEIKMYQDLPYHQVQETLQEAMFKEHALGRPVAGNEESLSRLDHDCLAEFKDAYYRPSSTVMAFAGKLNHSDCVQCVEKYFGMLPAGEAYLPAELNSACTQDDLIVTGKEISQVHAVIGFRIFGRHDRRRYALRVLNALLGENMSSRLFQSVRERHGLCYSIQSGYQLFSDGGIFSISGGFDASRAFSALELTASELRKLSENGIGEDELNRTQKYLQGTFRLALESVGSRMNFLGESYLNYRHVRSPEEMLSGIKAVQIEDVEALIAEILTGDNMTLAVVAPNELSIDKKRWLESVQL
ncbi:MAG: pitrilysin family protein [Kiritimatiellia bacterium]